MTEEDSAALIAKVMVLENAVALALVGMLGRHPDPLGALAALEHNLDRLVSGIALEGVRKHGRDTADRLIQACQVSLDEIEEYRAKRRPSSD